MSQQLIYQLGEHDSNAAAYRALTDAIADVADRLDENVFSVRWATPNHEYGSRYEVVGTDSVLREDTLLIEGQSRGGRYEVAPKPDSPPLVRYHHPEDGVRWTEEATSLVIESGEFAYHQDESGSVFRRLFPGLGE